MKREDSLCSICQKPGCFAYVCTGCRSTYDLSEPWAQALIQVEKGRRNTCRRDERFGFTEADPKGEYSFEDIVGYKGGEDVFANDEDEQEYLREEEQQRARQTVKELRAWAEAGGLSKAEWDAFSLLRFDYSGEEAASILSEEEGKTITPAAYRRRVSTARKKIKRSSDLLRIKVPKPSRK
jgi:hypothetical protein